MKHILLFVGIMFGTAAVRLGVDKVLGLDVMHGPFGGIGGIIHIVVYMLTGGIVAFYISWLAGLMEFRSDT